MRINKELLCNAIATILILSAFIIAMSLTISVFQIRQELSVGNELYHESIKLHKQEIQRRIDRDKATRDRAYDPTDRVNHTSHQKEKTND